MTLTSGVFNRVPTDFGVEASELAIESVPAARRKGESKMDSGDDPTWPETRDGIFGDDEIDVFGRSPDATLTGDDGDDNEAEGGQVGVGVKRAFMAADKSASRAT